MPKKCIVPGCKTGYNSCKEKIPIFSAPKNNTLREQWQKSLQLPKLLSEKNHVCAKHFRPDSIVKTYKLKDESGHVLAEVPLKHVRLETGAVPTILPLLTSIQQQDDSCNKENLPMNENMTDKELDAVHALLALTETCLPSFVESIETPAVVNDCGIELCTDFENTRVLTRETSNLVSHNLFTVVLRDPNVIQTPANWFSTSSPSKENIVFYELLLNDSSHIFPTVRRSLIIGNDMKIKFSANGIGVNPLALSLPDKFDSLENMNETLKRFASLNICCGIAILDHTTLKRKIVYTDNSNQLRHNLCPIVTAEQQCDACKAVKKHICQKKRRMRRHGQTGNGKTILQQKTISEVCKRKLGQKQRALRRAKIRIAVQKNEMLSQEAEIKKLKEENVLRKCEELGIPDSQKTCVKEIMAAAQKKDSKGHRYTEEWVMLCMLMHIRSPSGYQFLRKNGILPVPSLRTIRRYLSLINMKCGFDKHFFAVFEKYIRAQDPIKKHGLLLVDEISLRESLSVHSSDLTYIGLVDFGEDGEKAQSVNEKAKNGLVLMFQPLADKYTQPIAVFVSCGPVKGVELAKLVTKALILLENAGAAVHGIVSDGAETNRKMWSELGVGGKIGNVKNWFTHPADDNRQVFVFSDTPHLFKCVRNRLCSKQKRLRLGPNEPFVRWTHFEALYYADRSISETQLRICPKLTPGHLELSNTSKMKVRLATQVFSNSVVHGLKFYKARGVPRLEDCEATIDFCQRLNDLFDALNRKMPNEGLTPSGNDFKILQSSLEWLDNWETNYRDGKIQASEFLTSNTAEGLRVTIRSTMDISETLTAKHGFEYILTGRINQDSLEKFFGIIRQAAGANDHPSTPTFLQLYKLLSMYSIVKPPSSGNCTVTEVPKTLITLSELRSIYEKPTKRSMKELKDRLDGLIEETEWEFDDVVEHDYSHAPVIDCIVYYVTGYVCKHIEKHFPCEKCKKSIRAPITFSEQSFSELVNLKSRGGLIHSSTNFFLMLRELEACFSKNVHSPNVYSETVSEMIRNYKFSFPCKQHAQELLAYAIKYYMRMRMRQYSQQVNKNVNKQSAAKKRQAKYYKN